MNFLKGNSSSSQSGDTQKSHISELFKVGAEKVAEKLVHKLKNRENKANEDIKLNDLQRDEQQKLLNDKEKPVCIPIQDDRAATSLKRCESEDDFLSADEDIHDDDDNSDAVKNDSSRNNCGDTTISTTKPNTNSADMDKYIQKKSLAQGMMDLALLSANTNQMRYMLDTREVHPYFMTGFLLIVLSLVLQISVGLILIWNSQYNVKKKREMAEADKANNFSVIGIFLITLINVFIATFGSGGSLAVNTNGANGDNETINADEIHI